jgi:hypothetical protein
MVYMDKNKTKTMVRKQGYNIWYRKNIKTICNGCPKRTKTNKTGTYLGDVILSNVKITSGGGTFGPVALPNNITVSPDITLLTRAIPVFGKIIGFVVLVVVVVVVDGSMIFLNTFF